MSFILILSAIRSLFVRPLTDDFGETPDRMHRNGCLAAVAPTIGKGLPTWAQKYEKILNCANAQCIFLVFAQIFAFLFVYLRRQAYLCNRLCAQTATFKIRWIIDKLIYKQLKKQK